mmetsp:Transcript_2830/g.7700  ORF Transcript_2830/g.7700 Transcript_2830/m.7700 type:complete len:231 (-) Transcript_2830:439-1131(-)
MRASQTKPISSNSATRSGVSCECFPFTKSLRCCLWNFCSQIIIRQNHIDVSYETRRCKTSSQSCEETDTRTYLPLCQLWGIGKVVRNFCVAVFLFEFSQLHEACHPFFPHGNSLVFYIVEFCHSFLRHDRLVICLQGSGRDLRECRDRALFSAALFLGYFTRRSTNRIGSTAFFHRGSNYFFGCESLFMKFEMVERVKGRRHLMTREVMNRRWRRSWNQVWPDKSNPLGI